MYATIAELRAMNGLGDDTVYPDPDLTLAIGVAKATIDQFCGTSFGDVTTPAFDAFTVTLDGNGQRSIVLRDLDGYPVLFPRAISSVTIDGVADSGISYVLHATGLVVRDSEVFAVSTVGGQNVVIVGTAGRTDDTTKAGFEDLRWAAQAIGRNWLLNLNSRVPDRAINLTTPEGNFEVRAQPGGVGRPTGMPDVNAVLNRHKHVMPLG